VTHDGEVVSLELSEDERRMLFYGLIDWGGPASDCPEPLAVALGFENTDDLAIDGRRIADDIYDSRAVSDRDWTRALFAAEIIFASDLLGTGSEWTTIHGGDDAYWLEVLRGLQQKIPGSRRHLGGE
jgi:hypothetical protein